MLKWAFLSCLVSYFWHGETFLNAPEGNPKDWHRDTKADGHRGKETDEQKLWEIGMSLNIKTGKYHSFVIRDLLREVDSKN